MATISKLENYQVYTDTQALNDLKIKAREESESALRPVAEQFEAIFVEQILKESRKVKLDDGWLDGDKADFYKDWHDKQFAQSISAKGGLGLADIIVEQLAPKHPVMSQEAYEAHRKNMKDGPQEQVMKPLTTQNNLDLRKALATN